MITGTVVNTLAHCEAHIEIVRKARSIAVADPKFRSPHEIMDEFNAMMITYSMPVLPKVHYVLVHDVQDSLNRT